MTAEGYIIDNFEKHLSLIIGSYRRWTGKELLRLAEGKSLREQADEAHIVLLSHGTEADPVLNYGNAHALRLWEMDWQQFTSTPSRLTAEPMEREERARFMQQVTERGFVDNYTGVRISATGRRFYIIQATVWNLIDEEGRYAGQAAAFTDFRDIEMDAANER